MLTNKITAKLNNINKIKIMEIANIFKMEKTIIQKIKTSSKVSNKRKAMKLALPIIFQKE